MFLNNSKYIACVKVDGNILKDDANGVVNLPFGSTYSILLKNLNSVRATVKVSVDSVDATEGTSLIIPANGSVELERFIKNGNLGSGNKFKFIERTSGIEAHKGIGAEDGLVRVEYFGEVVQPTRLNPTGSMTVMELASAMGVRAKDIIAYLLIHGTFATVNQLLDLGTVQDIVANFDGWTYWNTHRPYYPPPPPPRPWYPSTPCYQPMRRPTYGASPMGCRPAAAAGSRSPIRAMGMRSMPSASASSAGPQRKMKSFTDDVVRSAAFNDVGITVPGAESNQRFVPGQWFKTETTGHVIVLQLRGIIGGKPVTVPVTVKSKRKCDTCGKVNKPSEKFCGECGTALTVI